MSIMQGEKDIRRAALTGAELSAPSEDVGCYKGLGRSFVKEPKSAVLWRLENTVKASRAEIEQCTLQREHLKKTLAETETNIKELLTGNEALSRSSSKTGTSSVVGSKKTPVQQTFLRSLFAHAGADGVFQKTSNSLSRTGGGPTIVKWAPI